MRVLLLGATGLLGHNVLQQLTATGHQVVAVVRRRSAVKLEPADTLIVEGDITHSDTVVTAAEGCDAIINCAGVTDMSLRHYEEYTAVNVTLCQTLIEAMKRHGISRLVHASTVNTIGNGSAGHPADEQEAMRAPFDRSHYAVSKWHGEQLLLETARDHPDWHVVVVNPGYMIGPMDVKPSSGRMLLLGYRRHVMFAPRGGKAFVDVRDVATAMIHALTMGRNGERYIAVNRAGHHTIKELYQLQAQTMGYRQKVLTLPDGLLSVAGWLGDVARRLGVRTELSTCNVRQLMVREYYDNSRAVAELAMPETAIEQSIRDFYLWRETRVEAQQRERVEKNIEMKKVTIMFAACLLLVGCHSRQNEAIMKKSSSGKTCEVLLAADRNVYYGETKDLIDSILREVQPGLPQPELRFDVVNIPVSSLHNTQMFMMHRNIILCDVNPENPDKVYIGHDKWATPQTMVDIAASSDSSLRSLLRRYEQTIKREIYNDEHQRIINAFYNMRNVELMHQLKNKFGFEITLSEDFRLAKTETEDPDFAWVHKETKDFTLGVLIHTMPYRDERQFENGKILDRLDTIMRRNIAGPAEGSYMGTERRFNLEQCKVDYKGSNYCIETRGQWRTFGDFMGGPFVSYTLLSPDGTQIVEITGFVYCPRFNKRDYLMQVEGICNSIRWDK